MLVFEYIIYETIHFLFTRLLICWNLNPIISEPCSCDVILASDGSQHLSSGWCKKGGSFLSTMQARYILFFLSSVMNCLLIDDPQQCFLNLVNLFWMMQYRPTVEDRRWIRSCLAVRLVLRALTNMHSKFFKIYTRGPELNKEPTHHSSQVLPGTSKHNDVCCKDSMN